MGSWLAVAFLGCIGLVVVRNCCQLIVARGLLEAAATAPPIVLWMGAPRAAVGRRFVMVCEGGSGTKLQLPENPKRSRELRSALRWVGPGIPRSFTRHATPHAAQ